MSGPDELLVRIDKWLDNPPLFDPVMLLRDCRTHIAANAALAAENEALTQHLDDAYAAAGHSKDSSKPLAAVIAALAARCEKARADALEEAARLCEGLGKQSPRAWAWQDGCNHAALAIRALASQAEGEK